jgi:polar amino acid transport system substrate-binding protein
MDKSNFNRRQALKAGALGAGILVAATTIAATQPARAQAAGSSTWDQIKSRGELRIGVTPSEPWFAKDQRSGEWSGLGWMTGVAMARELNVKPVAVETTWSNAVAGLQADQFDLMFVLDATPQRAMAIDFPVQPMLYYALGVLVRDGITVKKWEDLNKPEIRIGVTIGTSGDRDMTAIMTKAKLERFPNTDETTAAFQSGRVDAISFFHPALVMQQARIKKGTVVLPEPFSPYATSVGVRRQADKTWRDWVGLTLNHYYTTGQTQKLYEEHLKARGIDPSKAPAVNRELWGKS